MSRKTRKLMWSVPIVAALAIVGMLAIFMALQPGNASANQLPAGPGVLTVEAAEGDAGRTTLVLNWGAAADASGYRIDMSDQGAVWETMVSADDPHTGTTYTDTDLTAEDTRWYRVFAVNSHGIGPVSNAASGTTDKKVNPGSVMNLQAMPNTKNPYNHIDLSWDPPAQDGGEKIVGYEVQYHNGAEWGPVRGTFAPNEVTVTTKTTITDMSADAAELDAGDKRLYRVRAINGPDEVEDDDDFAVPDTAAAELSRSEEWAGIEGMTKEASDPGQVTGLTVVNAGLTAINLYWYDPADTGGWDITGYLVQARRHGQKFPSIPKNDDLLTQPTTVTLGAGTDNVYLNNANRYVARNDSANVLQAAFENIAPVDHDGDGSTDGADGGTAPRQVQWYFRVFAVTVDDGPDDAQDLTDLPDGTNDDNVIRRSRSASSEAGDTAEERVFDHDDDADRTDGTPTPNVDPLVAPGIDPTGTEAEVEGTDHLEREIRLELTLDETATASNVKQIAYRIDYSKDGIAWKLLEDDTRFTGFGEDKPYDDDNGLAFDETRHYRVFTIGKGPFTDVGLPSVEGQTGTTPSLGSTKGSTIPDAPTGVSASSPTLRSIMASWTAPEDNGGQDIVKYYYQYVLDDGDNVPEATDFTATNANPLVTAAPPVLVHNSAATMGTFEIKAPTAALRAEDVYVFRVAAVNKTPAGVDRPATTATGDDINWSSGFIFNTTEAAKPGAVEGLTSEAATDSSGDVTGVNLLWNKPSSGTAPTKYDVEVQDDEGDWVSPALGAGIDASPTSYTDPDRAGQRTRCGSTACAPRTTSATVRGRWSTTRASRLPIRTMRSVSPAASPGRTTPMGQSRWNGHPARTPTSTGWRPRAVRMAEASIPGSGSTVWEKADMAGSHTLSADDVSNLNSGEYAFTVIAGNYDEAADDTTWSSAWAAFTVVNSAVA